MKKGMMGKGMMMGQMMMKAMDRSVTATSDGGVVIVAGNKITKYDKDLNVVKEAEVKVDADGMQKNMEQMMKMCPMMEGGMMGMDESEGTDESPSGTKAGSSDHEAHH